MSVPFDLTCWYLNARRIAEFAGFSSIEDNRVTTSDQLQRIADLDAIKRSAVDWIVSNNPPPLGKLLTEGTLREGTIFTINDRFYFKGLSNYQKTRKIPLAYAKLDEWQTGLRLTFDFHPDHLTSNSAWAHLTGQQRMFVLGVVTEKTDNEIKSKPYVIANVLENGGFLGIGRWANHLEVMIDQIDNFAKVRDYRPKMSKKSLEPLKDVPEQSVKEAFADILNEPTIPKDWGGEQSDMFSTQVVLDGRRVSTAFAFKGPAAFKPMTMAQLGKNGDQINRLYDEPADLLVLQHCHEVTPHVRKTMRAYAQQMGNPRTYCVIDGYDTLRLLQAYGKCGFARVITQ